MKGGGRGYIIYIRARNMCAQTEAGKSTGRTLKVAIDTGMGVFTNFRVIHGEALTRKGVAPIVKIEIDRKYCRLTGGGGGVGVDALGACRAEHHSSATVAGSGGGVGDPVGADQQVGEAVAIDVTETSDRRRRSGHV